MHLIHRIIPRKGKLLKAGTSEVLQLLTEAVLFPHARLCFRELRSNPRLHPLTLLIVTPSEMWARIQIQSRSDGSSRESKKVVFFLKTHKYAC